MLVFFPFFSSALLLTAVLPATSHAAAWTASGKIRYEITEITLALNDWSFENALKGLEVTENAYLVKTEKCKFKVSFSYQQPDPERGIKRTLEKRLLHGKKADCDSVFRAD